MSTLISREQSSHWYLPTGDPFYSVPCKSRPGEMRSVTIADARSAGALPSVTNILSVISKPSLTAWLQEQAIMSAITLPRSVDEPLDLFAKRVVIDMEAQGRKAAEAGTQIHEACADFVEAWGRSDLTVDNLFGIDTLPHAVPFCEWAAKNITRVHAVEQVFVGDGYAGRVDLIADIKDIGRCVIDIKTQAIKNGKPSTYPEWGLQLAAYRAAYHFPLSSPPPNMVSIVINSKEPGPIHVHQWPEANYYDSFLAAFQVWKYVKGWA